MTQARSHFAQPKVVGGIMVFLCGTATNPGPAGTPTRPQSSTVSRTLVAADVPRWPGKASRPARWAA